MAGSIAFDRVADSYDATRGGMTRGREIAAVLAALLPADGPALEIGVGTGLVAAGLAERGRPPLGVDLSRPMLERARGRIPGRLAVADALALPVADGVLAGAYLVHVLHLVADIPATLAEVRRVLRPGGIVAATAFGWGTVTGDVHEQMDAIRVALSGEGGKVDGPLVERTAADAGLVPVGRRELTGRGITPREAGDLLAARSLSWMWSVPDPVWERDASPALARLRALPEQDTPRPAPGPVVLSFRRP